MSEDLKSIINSVKDSHANMVLRKMQIMRDFEEMCDAIKECWSSLHLSDITFGLDLGDVSISRGGDVNVGNLSITRKLVDDITISVIKYLSMKKEEFDNTEVW